MTTSNIFEYAVRQKLRFPFKGNISVEDLWDLKVEDLDKIFKTLNAQVKQAKEESLLETKSKEDEVLDVQIAIVKHIVAVKLKEKADKAKAAENKEKRQKILSILAARDEAALENASDEELKKMLENL